MAQVLIRDVDDAVLARLEAKAADRRQSLETHLRDILVAAADGAKSELLENLRRIRAMSPPLPTGAPLAEELIREDRDTR